MVKNQQAAKVVLGSPGMSLRDAVRASGMSAIFAAAAKPRRKYVISAQPDMAQIVEATY